jgi:hypothetical protein
MRGVYLTNPRIAIITTEIAMTMRQMSEIPMTAV